MIDLDRASLAPVAARVDGRDQLLQAPPLPFVVDEEGDRASRVLISFIFQGPLVRALALLDVQLALCIEA